MNSAVKVILTILLVIGLGSPGFSQTPKVVTFRLGDELAPEEPQAVGDDAFAKEVATLSNGRYKINVYHNGQLGAERDMFEQVRQGTLDFGTISTAPVGAFAPCVNLLQLPFLEGSLEVAQKVAESNLQMKIMGPVEALGVKVLRVTNAGMRYIISIKPVRKLADLKGMKFRTAQNQMHMDIFRALGASPTPMAYGEIYTGLQNKVIDGLENDLPGITFMKFYEVAKNMTMDGHFSWPGLLVVSKKTWDSIPTADRPIFERAAGTALKVCFKVIADDSAKLIQGIKDAKVNLITLTDADLAEFRKASQPIYDKYVTDQAGRDYVAAVEKLKKK